jgi:hypothetical protein
MKMYRGMEIIAPLFLTSTLHVGEWSASCAPHFILRERATGTYRIGGWMGPRAGLDAVEKRKNTCPYRELNPSFSTVQLIPGRYTH